MPTKKEAGNRAPILSADPDRIYAVVSPRSRETSLFETRDRITENNVEKFCSEQGTIDETVRELQDAGFEILDIGDATISIVGTRKQFKEVFGAVVKKRKKTIFADDREQTAEFFGLDVPEGEPEVLSAPERLSPLIEGVAFAQPPEYFVSALPPLAPVASGAYRYLDVPDEVAMILNAERIHRLGTTGRGIRVAMVDTGQYRHPFFNRFGLRVKKTVLGPGATDPDADPVGHGTGESANIFATAPDIQLIPVKMAWDSTGAFNKAVAEKPHVITCSWGYNVDKPGNTLSPYLKTLEVAVSLAVLKKITVCFSAGNGQYAFPASHPSVIAVGGVHVNYPALDLEASSYASSFKSTFYPGRSVPDVCGLVGKKVSSGAPLIMLPVPPGSSLDLGNTGSTGDGWGIFSGTSAASPQVAGIVALLLEKKPGLTPAQAKKILMESALDVQKGKSRMGHTATTGPDLATGAGLANAKWAWLITMGGVTAEFFEAAPAVQQQMLEAGEMPALNHDMVDELIETLRSRA